VSENTYRAEMQNGVVVLLSPDGEVLTYGEQAHMVDIGNWLRIETAPLLATIASQNEALADMQAALQAQSETIAAWRKNENLAERLLEFIHDAIELTGTETGLDYPTQIEAIYQELHKAVESATPQSVVDTAPESPRFKVGDRVRIISHPSSPNGKVIQVNDNEYLVSLGGTYSYWHYADGLAPYTKDSESAE